MNKQLLLLCFFLMNLGWVNAGPKIWKCINEKGEVQFTVEAKRVSSFQNGMAVITKAEVIDNKWVYNKGFIDATGKIVIQPQYDKVKGNGFVNGRAWVKMKNSDYWSLIDETGKVIPTNKYEKVGYLFDFNPNVTAVYRLGKLGFIDMDGKEIIPCKYLGDSFFKQGLACVSLYNDESGYGFINAQGEVVIPFQFKQAGTAAFMDNGMCRATVSGSTVLIDKTGKVVFKTSKGNIQGVSNDWVRIFTKANRKGWGYIDMNGATKIDFIYDDLSSFNDLGYAIAEKGGLKGIIGTDGKTAIEFKYATIYNDPTEDGYIMAVYPTDEPMSLANTPKDYFNTQFEKIDLGDIAYVYSANGSKLLPFRTKDHKLGYLDRDFNVVIEANYDVAEEFSEGLAWVR